MNLERPNRQNIVSKVLFKKCFKITTGTLKFMHNFLGVERKSFNVHHVKKKLVAHAFEKPIHTIFYIHA